MQKKIGKCNFITSNCNKIVFVSLVTSNCKEYNCICKSSYIKL